MKNIKHTIAISRFICIILWISILFIPQPSWEASYYVENNTRLANEPAGATSTEQAVILAKKYLGIDNAANFKFEISERVITPEAFNTYKVLKPGISRLCWVVTIINPGAVGAGRTVYVDKESGEIHGGYSSK